MSAQDNKVTQKIEIRQDIKPPSLYNVIFINDNVTTMDFVIAVLMDLFGYSQEEAFELTKKIHVDGFSVVAVYPYELAEQKALETTLLARNNSFPLMVKIEESNT